MDQMKGINLLFPPFLCRFLTSFEGESELGGRIIDFMRKFIVGKDPVWLAQFNNSSCWIDTRRARGRERDLVLTLR